MRTSRYPRASPCWSDMKFQVLKNAAWIGLFAALLPAAALVAQAPPQFAQATPAASPEPIYWRQNLLTVPYQWSTTGNSKASKAVWLYVSKDRGATWRLVADGESRLLSFNYRAEADGEYWFAVRTTDSGAARMPASLTSVAALQPELKVVVDTTSPRIESLTAHVARPNSLEVQWRSSDANLASQSCVVEAQFGATGDWQTVPTRGETQVGTGIWEGTASLVLAVGSTPTSVRATVVDLAKNRARSQASIDSNGNSLAIAPVPAASAISEPGWTAGSAPSVVSNQFAPRAEPQLWPADRSGRNLPAASTSPATAVAYGTPIGVGPVGDVAPAPADALRIPEPTTEDRPLGNVPPQHDSLTERSEIFHTASLTHSRGASNSTRPKSDFRALPLPVNPLARRVNSRSFALEYELADVGAQGVAKVEAWGTHDGGKTWQRFAVDDDNRSPLEVTVDGGGEYGFSIVVGGSAENAVPPQSGDTPALWIDVDLEPPIARILAVNSARGEAGGELTVTWEADDAHLEPRPIALYYSSRPAGPWTPIATSVANVGEFTWPIERHVPRRVYLKLEARDAAGNVAAFQTAEPVITESEPAVARWQRLPPIQ
ncbi:MAG: hypothetical protein AB7G28_04825 [Pirellulales bacterium]